MLLSTYLPAFYGVFSSPCLLYTGLDGLTEGRATEAFSNASSAKETPTAGLMSLVQSAVGTLSMASATPVSMLPEEGLTRILTLLASPHDRSPNTQPDVINLVKTEAGGVSPSRRALGAAILNVILITEEVTAA